MRKLLVAVFFLLQAAVCVQAQTLLKPNWGYGDVTNPAREVTNDANANNPLAIVGGGSIDGGMVADNALTINGWDVSIDEATAQKSAKPDRQNKPAYGAYEAGGATFNNKATGNKLSLLNLGAAQMIGRDAYGARFHGGGICDAAVVADDKRIVVGVCNGRIVVFHARSRAHCARGGNGGRVQFYRIADRRACPVCAGNHAIHGGAFNEYIVFVG